MTKTLFRYIHLSDFHLCIEPRRRNALELISRFPRDLIDTVYGLTSQGLKLGAKSLLNPASYEPGQLSGVARFCYDWSDTADGIILTGDLCTTGLLQDIRVGETFLREAAQDNITTTDNSPTIAKFGNLVRLIPGNHDRYIDNAATPNGKLFDLKFGDFMPNFANRVGYWVDQKFGITLCFICADFCIKNKNDVSKLNRYGRGRVYDDILKDMLDITSLLRKKYKNAHSVWVMHFAPYDCGSNIKLEDSQKLISAAEELGVEVILNGHTHKKSKTGIGKVTAYCASSSCGADVSPKNHLHLIEFNADSTMLAITRRNFAWNMQEQVFFEIGSD